MAGRQRKSKKRYAANDGSKQLDSPVFLLDEALGGKIVPQMLLDAGFSVQKLIDHFPRGTLDVDWLAEVGRRGWVVLSKDNMIRKRRLEREALLKADVAAFILTSANMTGEEMGRAFVLAHKRMLRILASNTKPFIASVSRSGKVKLLV